MANSLTPGNLLRDRYRIEALIGQGGMGAVYRVADERLPGRTCALKVMVKPSRELLGEHVAEAARQQFLAEASTLGRLDHPNLPKVSDYFSLDDYDCLVMDYVSGPDLQQRIQEARRQGKYLALDDIIDWMSQLCDVLSYLHTQQPPIIHGDIKPANIKLTHESRVKLVDFGLVRPGNADDPRTLTGSGLRGAGSLPYAALEQYAGTAARVDARTDLYSLGATLYHLVTNLPPASAHDRFLEPGLLAPPRQLNPSLPSGVEEAILAALQPHPKDRPDSVAAWWQLLARVEEHGSEGAEAAASVARLAGGSAGLISQSAVDARTPTWASWRQNLWYAVAAAILVVAALALTFFR